ncbi:MAG: hypothetical protein U0235_06415 [Polyangiaceae bacterium]
MYWYCVRVGAAADAHVLHGLQEEVHAHRLPDLGSQARDDAVRRGRARRLGSQVDEHVSRVAGRSAEAAADERHRVGHVGIGEDDGVERFLASLHRRERHVLRRLRDAGEHARVLLREEPFGHDDEEGHGDEDRGDRDSGHEGPVTEDPPEGAPVGADLEVEASLEPDEDARRRRLVLGACTSQEARAHHGRERERDHGRDGDRHREGDRELAKESAHDAAHQEERDEHGEERRRDRHDGETDLARPLERRGERRLAGLDEARDVLGDHDRVVDDEARRDGERHERQVVEAVA